MATLFGMFPFLQKLFADGGYQGPEFSTALATATRSGCRLRPLRSMIDDHSKPNLATLYRRSSSAMGVPRCVTTAFTTSNRGLRKLATS